MPPRRGRGRTTGRTVEESRALESDENVAQPSEPLRRRSIQTEVEDVMRQIGDMELVLARFQRTNPPTFSGAEGGMMAEGWLEHIEELFDVVEYSQERRLKLAVLQLRENAQRWWNGTSRVMRESGTVRPKSLLRLMELTNRVYHRPDLLEQIWDEPALSWYTWLSYRVRISP
ncbi:hypothetical protein F511_10146 [Dorcoceras hygrometricum]|uniref:Uncharacterized protein n=1 Tax=Dorcoceras hygrometricum TaxID=472368 RepID=A0A2Z7BJX7_9LAMI|nr:hypothetical protein F511_10146 [Dorcoceras hygrometricum]